MLGLGKEILRYGRRGDSKTHISLLIQIFEKKKRYNPWAWPNFIFFTPYCENFFFWAQLQAAKIFQIHQKFPFLNRTTTKFLWTQKSFGKIFRLFSVSKEIFWECSVHFFRGPWPRQVTYIAQKMMFFAPRSSPISPVSPLKVSKFQKQIFLFSFEAKTEQNNSLISALVSKKRSNQKK